MMTKKMSATLQSKSEIHFEDHPSMIHMEERKSIADFALTPLESKNEIHVKPDKCELYMLK